MLLSTVFQCCSCDVFASYQVLHVARGVVIIVIGISILFRGQMVIEVNSLAFGRGNILLLILALLLKLLVANKIVAIVFLPLLIEFMRVLNLDFVDEMFNSFVILVFIFMFLLHLQQLLFLVLYLLRQFEQRLFITVFVLSVC